MIHSRFIEYFQQTFFQDNPEEFEAFCKALTEGIPRTIRIKPDTVQEVKSRLEEYGFILSETYIPNVFSLGRSEDFNPLERRIGYTPDHLVGNFYIQELAAATSVHILAEGKIHSEPFLILDMASSPGGKTTQLSEHYPGSFIIANEPTRERIPQLLQNLERMGSSNIGITLYPGQYFKNTPEIFDRILLDAPCSGEGTLYK
jgi:16S rRNA (cytosine1407-C5)-methyltransferase